MVYAHQVNWN